MNTLVTKLKATTTNPNLPKLGMLSIYFDTVETPTAIGQGFTLQTSPDTLLKTENGNFTNSALTDNLGTEATATMTGTKRYVSNGAVLNVMNKYNLTKITLRGDNLTPSNRSQVKHIRMDIGELGCSQITTLLATNTSCYGDIKTAFLNNNVCQYIDLDDTDVSGNVSAFYNKNTLVRILLNTTRVYGNIVPLFSLPLLTNLSVSNLEGNVNTASSNSIKQLYMHDCPVTGSITFLDNLTIVQTIEIHDCLELTGSINDISLPSSCAKFVLRHNDKITGSIATFRANNPNCTNVSISACSNVTE